MDKIKFYNWSSLALKRPVITQIRHFHSILSYFILNLRCLKADMKIQNILNTLHLNLLNVDHCRVQNWNFKKVTSPFSRIYLVENGHGRITYNKKIIELTQGKIYLIPSFTECSYESSSYLEHYYIHFAPFIFGGVNVY